MHRFFVSPTAIYADVFRSTEKDLCHQLGRVLKIRVGQQAVLCDNSEHEYLVEFTGIGKTSVEAKVLKKTHKPDMGSQRPVHLYCALLKNQNRWEDMLEKCTELGVASFTPLVTERTEAQALRKPERLHRIIQEAAELSGRTLLPILNEPLQFSELLKNAPKGNNLIPTLLPQAAKLLTPHSSLPTPHSQLLTPHSQLLTNLFIGPVGDFTGAEIEQAIQKNFQPVSLGSQVLRTETAAIIASGFILIS
ncbi:MAG: RsmE family RNA methyltransferase [bacterium]|nr:RsmE family RNA methyltransferase [bacterium]